MGLINCKIEADPFFPVVFETLDITRADRGGLRARIELRLHLKPKFRQRNMFIQTVDGFLIGMDE